jgi:hypothetical protein
VRTKPTIGDPLLHVYADRIIDGQFFQPIHFHDSHSGEIQDAPS